MENKKLGQLKKESKLILFIIIGIVVVLSLILVTILVTNKDNSLDSRSKAAISSDPNQPNVIFAPSTIQLAANQEVTATLKASIQNPVRVQTYKIILNFKKSKLQLTDISYKFGTVTSPTGDDNSKLSAINTNCPNDVCTITIRSEIQNGEGRELASSLSDLISLRFKSLGNDSSSIDLSPTISSQFVVLDASGVGKSLYILPANYAGLTVNQNTPAPTGTPKVVFAPSSLQLAANQEGTTVIKASIPNSVKVQTYRIILNFKKSKLQVTDISYKFGNVTSPIGDENSKLSAINTNCPNDLCVINIRGEIQSGEGKILSSTPSDIASIKFKYVGSENTSVTLSSVTSSQFVIINSTGVASSLNILPANFSALTVINGTTRVPQTSTSTVNTTITTTTRVSCGNPPACRGTLIMSDPGSADRCPLYSCLTPPTGAQCSSKPICKGTLIITNPNSTAYCPDYNCIPTSDGTSNEIIVTATPTITPTTFGNVSFTPTITSSVSPSESITPTYPSIVFTTYVINPTQSGGNTNTGNTPIQTERAKAIILKIINYFRLLYFWL